MDRRHWRADHLRGQHRHRWLRPRTGDGIPGATSLCRRRNLGALRLQRRPGRRHSQARRTRSRLHAIHCGLQNVYDAGDVDERDCSTALAHRHTGRGRGGQALRRCLHQQDAGGSIRHRLGQHVRLLGLGGRPLLCRVSHRAVADGGNRPRGIHRLPVRVPPRRPALRHRTAGIQRAGTTGPDWSVVLRFLRRRDSSRAAVLQRPGPLRRLPSAVDHGVQR